MRAGRSEVQRRRKPSRCRSWNRESTQRIEGGWTAGEPREPRIPRSVKQAAGILAITPDGRLLLMRRVDSGLWAFPGGGLEGEENAEAAARREFQEETGRVADDLKLLPWTRRQRDDVDFTTFLAQVPDAFAVLLNSEHCASAWVTREAALSDAYALHPGARVALLKFDMTELDVAKAIQAGDLTSPQRFGNLLLVAMRITGTGAAYRQSLDEFVWRDASLYLTPEFLERCNGLPVILVHPPDGKPIDSKDFHQRMIGTVFVPYIQGTDVWAITKIYDAAAQELLCTEIVSTSPMVVFRDAPGSEGATYDMGGGSTLLVENKPSLLDHVAVVEAGVWDKGGPASGVRLDTASDGSESAVATKVDAILELIRDWRMNQLSI